LPRRGAQGLSTLSRNRTEAEGGLADFISAAALPPVQNMQQSIRNHLHRVTYV
jgi:hypothetical protein